MYLSRFHSQRMILGAMARTFWLAVKNVSETPVPGNCAKFKFSCHLLILHQQVAVVCSTNVCFTVPIYSKHLCWVRPNFYF